MADKLQSQQRGVMYWIRMGLLCLLILAFAVWGIPDTFRRSSDNTIATIGKTIITPDQFRQSYDDEIRLISNQIGRRLSPDEARRFGIDARALSRLVGTTALDMATKDDRITISQQAAVDSIRADQSFAGMDGKFSKAAFENFLRQIGMSESGYLEIRRREEARDQLSNAMTSFTATPDLYVQQLHRYKEETRVVEYVALDPDKVAKISEPDDAKLKEYYDANKSQFMTPPYRKLALLLLTRDDVKSKIPVSDEDVKAAYEQDKDKFATPEKRSVQQLSFKDKASADKAYAELLKAKSFKEAAEKLGYKDSDINLGSIARKELIDPKIAEAAFTLKKDEISKPVEGQFTTVILRVTDIVAGTTKTYDQVKTEVKDKLANDRAVRELQALHDKVDDARSSGKSLKATGEALGITFKEYEAIDRAANGTDGKPVLTHPDTPRILNAAFGAAQGVEAESVDLTDGGYAWFDVLGVTPAAERPLDQVKADVKTTYVEIERKKALGEAVAKLVERVLKGEPIEAIAKEQGSKVEKTGAITRATSPTGLTVDAVRQAFGLPVGAASSAPTADGKSRTLFRVAEIKQAAAPTKEQADAIRADLGRRAEQDQINTYVSALQARYGVSINETALRQTLGYDR